MTIKKHYKSFLLIISLSALTIGLIWLPSDTLIKRIFKNNNKQTKNSITEGLEENDPYAVELEKIYNYHHKLKRFKADVKMLTQRCMELIDISFPRKKAMFPKNHEGLEKYFRILFDAVEIHDYNYRRYDFYHMAFNPPEGIKYENAVNILIERNYCETYQADLIKHAIANIRDPVNVIANRKELLSKTLKRFQAHLRTITSSQELKKSNQILKSLSELQMIDSSFHYPILGLNDEINFYLEEIDFGDADFMIENQKNGKEIYNLLKAEFDMTRTYALKIEELIRDISLELNYPI
ncbi:MAG: hypothetical protein JNM93_03035 [Bacteriovoracaceae bacterium]|nr:hypothetical protein [Bacteriovoracaceae bacterium]